MASKLSPATPRPKVQRGSNADGERISPATKTGAANMLGDNSPKATRSPRSFSTEKKTLVSRGAELQQVQDELSRTKEQLALMEKSKSNLLQDLARSKRQLEDLNSKLQDANEISKKDKLRAEEMEHASFKAAEDWEAELEIMRKQYEAAVLDLQTNKQAMENLKHELFVCIEAKDEAVRLAGEAMNAAERTAKRAEEMSVELLAAKGSSVMADSATARVDELIINPNSATEGLSEITATCSGSTEKLKTLLADKEIEHQASLQEVCHLRSEVESLKQELFLAQKLVREQTDLDKIKQEVAAAKEAELQNALQEAGLFQSESEILRQELLVAQQSVMEHGKSMNEAAAELANKDVELQIALKEASQLKSESESLRQDIALAQKSAMQQTDGADALRLYQSELAAANDSERKFQAQLLNMTSEVDRLSSELKYAKAAENNSSIQLANATSELEQLKSELADAGEDKEKAIAAENAAIANASRMTTEIAKAKESESVALSSLSALSAELTETQEKLAKANIEGSMLAGFLDSLKEDFERIKLDLAMVEGKEVHANERVEFLSLELTKMKEASQQESSLLKEQVASAQTAMDALKVDAERHKLELVDILEKEALAKQKIIDATSKLQNAETELAELKRQQTSASKKNIVLAEQLELNLKEISEIKQRELSMSATVASLLQALEDKKHEVAEWERKVDISDKTSTALMLDLQNTNVELSELKKKETRVSTKATALSVVLASLTEKNEARLNELIEKEAVASAKVEALNGELVKAKLDLEEALTAAKAARDEADKLQASFQSATLELDHVRQESRKFSAEATQNKEDAGVALIKLQEAKVEAEKALKVACLAESEVHKQSEEVKSLTLSLQMSQDDRILAKGEIECLSDKLRVTAAELHAHREEMEHLRQEALALRKEAETLQSSILAEKQQVDLAKDQAQAAREEVEKMKKEMHNMKVNEENAPSISKPSKDRLQDALKELPDATSAQMEASTQTLSTKIESSHSMPQEDIENLKHKVQLTEEHLTRALKEIENSHANTQIVSKNLEIMKLEKEAHEKALLEVHQHLADTEKAKSNLEAEIQRLLDESKQWQTMKDAIDIPIHPETLGRNFASDSRDEKPQPDSPSEASETPLSPLHKIVNGEDGLMERQEKVMNEHIALREDFACLSLRREDYSEKDESVVRDDASLYDEMISVPTKKKKKTLLVRLGTLLEKKKHTSQHTP
ncbi:hypothetical protein GOP47_0013330 [Adiantum capillus-veneris]|uniref:Uncharacterized protein n=1 Tax=Adiantum capillus-veneris TaxID=13818 RepID=A0A9D4ZDB4_ADICA|nr:hypothetical protein GOP47_0013330 [Adiantum capillus-veneris]